MNTEEIKLLHPLEIKVLLYYNDKSNFNALSLVKDLHFLLGQANQAISWLSQKSCLSELSRQVERAYEITPFGKEWQLLGSPAKRLFELVKDRSCDLTEAAKILNIEQKELGSAFGLLSKDGVLGLYDNKNIIIIKDELPEELIVCQKLLSNQDLILEKNLSDLEIKIINIYAKKRGLNHSPFRKIDREVIFYQLSEIGKSLSEGVIKMGLTGEELGALSSDLLKSGEWKTKQFRMYNTSLAPNRVSLGRRNSYSEFLQQVKDKLVGLGFEEFDGPLVETEFWNSDALFMPQFHAARDVHDVYHIKSPTHAKSIEEPWLSNVAQTHENGAETGSRGWNYKFDRNFTKRLILRSQGTVMSAKTLTRAKVPGKYFGILRVFRHDQVDATHLSDFYQTEGIMLGEDVNLKSLLGLLKIFAEEFAQAQEVKYVPGYFPFTEPSVEVHIKHQKLGWMELGGSGIFRPEVTRPLGIEVPVAAWGMGIDRMATMQMKINDLRDLFSNDFEKVSLRKGVII